MTYGRPCFRCHICTFDSILPVKVYLLNHRHQCQSVASVRSLWKIDCYYFLELMYHQQLLVVKRVELTPSVEFDAAFAGFPSSNNFSPEIGALALADSRDKTSLRM